MLRLPNTPLHHNPMVEHGTRPFTKGVVIHTIEGTDEGAEAWFANRQAGGIGAHVIIGQEPQRTIQVADLAQVCWHAVGANHTHIGFEHEGFASTSKAGWLSKANRHMLRASANRTAWVCWHYELGTPKKGVNVFAHADFPEGGHHDPGSGWPWTFYLYLCRRAYKRLVATGKWS